MDVGESANVGGPAEVSRVGVKAGPVSGSSSQVPRGPTPGYQAYQDKTEEGLPGVVAVPSGAQASELSG
eukprot:6960289-Lingulodinium_polyedra.AAC.1